MKPAMLRELAEDYGAALRDYLAGAEESALAHAYEIGRRAIESGLGVLDLMSVHREALTAALQGVATPEESNRTAMAAVTFLAESLAASEMVQQGYRAAAAKLLELKEELERSATRLAATNEELESEIAERRQAEEAARRAQEEAERANRAKSEFLSRMSHELRTPFNAVLGFAQLLEMDDLSPEQRESVEHILKGGKHLLDLINEVLDISRIESGRLTLSVEPVSLRELAEETLDLVQGVAAQAGIELRAEIPPHVESYVLADRQRLKQVLLNLASNAVKYNREGGTATMTWEADEEGLVRIEVTDTGQGVPAHRIDQLFSPFERLGVEHTGIEGTGLGLALSKRLVEAMGGTIGLHATSDQGSTFFVELPSAEAPVRRYEHMEGRISRSPGQLGAPRTVLYIEDNLSNLTLVERVLAHRPEVKIISALQGGLGVELAREHRPDLILLDVNLPDIPGGEVLRRLKDEPRINGIPVVVISADATSGQVKNLLAAGAHDYLIKPFDVQRFLEVVDKTLWNAT